MVSEISEGRNAVDTILSLVKSWRGRVVVLAVGAYQVGFDIRVRTTC